MTASYRIQQIAGNNRIEYQGHFYAAEELVETIWIVNMELRNGLPKRERVAAKWQIARYEALLAALREAGA
jgi:hypothetical protein